MENKFSKRLEDLLIQGEKLIKGQGSNFWVSASQIPTYQAWIASVANLTEVITGEDSYFVAECNRILSDNRLRDGIPRYVVQKILGLLASIKEEWAQGLLRKVEYIVAAETFDDFLDHASTYHKGNKKNEASALGSAVLEDTIKKIAKKNGINPSGLSLEPIINKLVKNSVFTPVKAKRIKGYVAVRNHALHAEWDKFDIRDVGELIKGTRELIEQFL